MFRSIFALPIHAYRRWLSPRKGYKCAHHAVHQSGSCSDRVLGFIEQESITRWPSLIRNQFNECKEASLTIKCRDNKGKHRNKKSKCDSEDLCDVADCFDSCNPFD